MEASQRVNAQSALRVGQALERLQGKPEIGEAVGIGDRVKIMETRPLSKDKRWRLVEIIEKAK